MRYGRALQRACGAVDQGDWVAHACWFTSASHVLDPTTYPRVPSI